MLYENINIEKKFEKNSCHKITILLEYSYLKDETFKKYTYIASLRRPTAAPSDGV